MITKKDDWWFDQQPPHREQINCTVQPYSVVAGTTEEGHPGCRTGDTRIGVGDKIVRHSVHRLDRTVVRTSTMGRRHGMHHSFASLDVHVRVDVDISFLSVRHLGPAENKKIDVVDRNSPAVVAYFVARYKRVAAKHDFLGRHCM